MKKVLLIIMCLCLLCGCSKTEDDNVINVLNWSSYLPDEVIDNFQKETGIKVNYNTYSSNEELLAKLSSSASGTYDLVFPSDYMVELMIQRDMLDKLDKNQVNNFNNISQVFLNQPFDRNNEYSLPFLAATTVICYNTENIKEDIKYYNDLLNDKYKNNIVLIDDQRAIIGIASLASGNDFNTTNYSELQESLKWLKSLKNNIKAYDSDSPKTFLITGEVDIGLIWNAEAILAQNENPNIKIIYPEEGHAISLDNYVIVKGAKHKDNVYKFIDYLLQSDISKQITDEYPYINVTKGASNYSSSELYDIINTGYYIQNVGEYISYYDKVWVQAK